MSRGRGSRLLCRRRRKNVECRLRLLDRWKLSFCLRPLLFGFDRLRGSRVGLVWVLFVPVGFGLDVVVLVGLVFWL